MNLIKDDQLVFVVREIPAGIGELGAVVLVLMVEVDLGCLFANLQSEGCLSGLARPYQDDRR